MSTLKKELLATIDGQEISLYTLSNDNMSFSVTEYGASITKILFSDKNGKTQDLVLGFDGIKGYMTNRQFIGATVGRYANRIGGGSFTIDGTKYELQKNEGKNTLHAGDLGFDKVIWNVKETTDNSITFKHQSPDGDMGFPGTVDATVTMTLSNTAIELSYSATTDKPTHVSLTNHSYFNLNGEGNASIKNHIVTIPSATYTEVDASAIPTGAIVDGTGTFFDLREASKVEEKLSTNPGLTYDHNFCLDNSEGLVLAAKAYSPETGISMTTHTTAPGVQFYCGAHLNGVPGKNGHTYKSYDGICFEAQHYPDSPNNVEFPSTLLKPGEEYTQKTVYTFALE